MIEDLKSGVYKLTNKFDRKIYVGQSYDVEKRYAQHCRSKNANKSTCVMTSIIKKYGIDSFDFDVLIRCPKENLDYWETFYIRYYCSNNPKFGYNKTSGGKSGFSVGQETKNKLSASHKGIITWNKGKKLHYKPFNSQGSKWMNNGEIEKMVMPDAINIHIEQGFIFGRL